MALGSVRLRGGYDANPQLLPGGRASAFAGVEGAIALARSYDVSDSKIGLTGEFQRLDYAARGLMPSERSKLALEAETNGLKDWSLRSSTSVESTSTYNLKSFDAIQRVRGQWTGGMLQPFLVGEARYSTLNETNVILTSFLPEDQRYLRGTLIPGVSAKSVWGELGVSVNLSATRYAQEPDLFGYRRNNERVQPYLFYEFSDDTLKLAASISQLRGYWHDVDFSPVRRTMFDASLSWKAKDNPWRLDLSGKRIAGETTFPISPITISEIYGGKLTYNGANWSAGPVARWVRTIYLDAPFNSSLVAYGLGATYEFGDGWTVGAELLKADSTLLDGEGVRGVSISFSVAKKFDFTPSKLEEKKEEVFKRTAVTPSNALAKVH